MINRHAIAAACVLCAAAPAAAWAQAPTPAATNTDAPKPWSAPASLSDWASSIAWSGQLDAGIVVNPQAPNDGVNFGRLMTDKANRPILNQLLLRLERDTDPKATGYDWGFKLDGLYGSDARIFHSLGVFDHLIHDRNQIDLTEADIALHAPWFSPGGVDLKGGLYPSPLGSEALDPKSNAFYSHSYIFDLLPYKHFGLFATAHLTPVVDLYFDIDTGSQTTIGSGDNNGRPAGIAGFGLNLLGGKLTTLLLTHIGPENPTRNTPFGNSALRYYNDAVVTFKPTDKLTFTTEGVYAKDDGFRAEAYGVAQYVSYALTDTVALNGRAEVLRDNANVFIITPVNNLDYVNSERGVDPSNFYKAARPTTYSEFTAGITYKPAGLPPYVRTFEVRPEIRYDRTLNDSRPFDDGKDKGSVTLATDLILGF